MAKKELKIYISAIVVYEDNDYDETDVENSLCICFRKEDKYSGEELFLANLNGLEVVEYQDVSVTPIVENKD